MGPTEYRAGEMVDVAVHNIVGTFTQEAAEASGEGEGVAAQATRNDLAPKRLYLRIVSPRLSTQSAKIQLKFLSVDIAHEMQERGFEPAGVQPPQDVQNPDVLLSHVFTL